MLAENMKRWEENFKREHREKGLEEGRKEGRKVGREEGLRQGVKQMLLTLLEQKFGKDERRKAKLDEYHLAQLQHMVAHILTANTEEELFALGDEAS